MNSKKILLVDDDKLFCKIMQRQASLQGVELTCCFSAMEIANLGNLEKFDAVMLDYHLGKVKGSSVASFLNRFFIDIPVVIVSAKSDWWLDTSFTNDNNKIKHFIHKERSPKEIIDIVLTTTEDETGAREASFYEGPLSDYADFEFEGETFVNRSTSNFMGMVGNLILASVPKFLRAAK